MAVFEDERRGAGKNASEKTKEHDVVVKKLQTVEKPVEVCMNLECNGALSRY